MELGLERLLRHKLFLATCTLLGLAAGCTYLWLVPTTYHAQARVLVRPQGVAPDEEMLRVDSGFLPTQAETIRSPITIERAIESLSLTRPRGVDAQEFDPVRHVLSSLSVTPVFSANVLTISYSCSATEEECLNVIERVIGAYRADMARLDFGNSESETGIVATREETLRAELAEAQREYDELRRESPFIGSGRDAYAQALLELNQLGAQISDVRRRCAELQAARQAIVVSPFPSEHRPVSTHVASKPVMENSERQILAMADQAVKMEFQEAQDRLRFARLRVNRLDQIYGDMHPELLQARAEATELELVVDERLTAIAQAWRHELDVAVATETALAASYEAEKRMLKATETFLVREEQLLGRIKTLESLHAASLDQLVKTQSAAQAIADGRSTLEVRVIDHPAILSDMTWPKPKLLLPASSGLGFVIGILCILFWDRSAVKANPAEQGNSTDWQPMQFEEILGTDVVEHTARGAK